MKYLKLYLTSRLLFTLYSYCMYSAILFFFWQWFIITVFKSLPYITIGHSFGIILFLQLFKKNNQMAVKYEYVDSAETAQLHFIFPFFLLIDGLILHILIK